MTLNSFFRMESFPETPVEWESLVKLASDEYVLPALAGRSEILALNHRIPPHILTVFSHASAFNAGRNKVILAEAVHAATLLNQIGIVPTALKGVAYLLTHTYPHSADRFLGDIDLLVPTQQISGAIRHLLNNGYFENDIDSLHQLRHHWPGLRREERPHIEIHHRVGQGVCDRLLPASEILAQAKKITVDGAVFLIPSPSHLVNHLILHSQLHHPYRDRVFPPLRALVDLLQLNCRFPNQISWCALEKTYRAAGESATLALHLQHTNHLLGTNFAVNNLPRLRWYRRLLLNRYPALRFLDPIYLLMSLFSRRLRLVPQILSHPAAWPKVLRTLISPTFYRNLFAL